MPIKENKKRYIFSSREMTKPRPKIYGRSEYKKQVIERDGKIYTVWEKMMSKSYILWFCYKTITEKSKLKKYKNI